MKTKVKQTHRQLTKLLHNKKEFAVERFLPTLENQDVVLFIEKKLFY
jgi:hypothetical protein